MNPFNGAMYNSEQAYRNGMMCESSQDMRTWRDFQHLHGIAIVPFGERPGCVLTGLSGQARIDECARLGAIQFPRVNPNRSAMRFKQSKQAKKTEITSNSLRAAKSAAKSAAKQSEK